MGINNNTQEEYCCFCGQYNSDSRCLVGIGNIYLCNECIKLAQIAADDIMSKTNSSKSKLKQNIQKPQQIKEYLDEHIIGQDDAKIALSVAVYNHYKRLLQSKKAEINIQKSNILILGPTGTGKTLLAQTLAKYLNVPFAISDATTLTEAGYVGEDVENVLLRLIENANFDIKAAEQGIIYIDEIDKISQREANRSTTRDVGGEGVQQALLKILEGTISDVPLKEGRKNPRQECMKIDTSNILFILGGAFVGLNKESTIQNNLGFNSCFEKDIEKSNKTRKIGATDLIKYGMLPELIGRIPVISELNPLAKEDLIRILTEPKNAIVKQYQKLMDMDKIKLEFTPQALI